jgi:hypothetical protein
MGGRQWPKYLPSPIPREVRCHEASCFDDCQRNPVWNGRAGRCVPSLPEVCGTQGLGE